MLVRVLGEHPPFTAGCIFEDGVVVKAAPILRWTMGLTPDQLRAEIRRRGLRAHIVRTLTRVEAECDG
jgi:hypothetical protein